VKTITEQSLSSYMNSLKNWARKSVSKIHQLLSCWQLFQQTNKIVLHAYAHLAESELVTMQGINTSYTAKY